MPSKVSYNKAHKDNMLRYLFPAFGHSVAASNFTPAEDDEADDDDMMRMMMMTLRTSQSPKYKLKVWSWCCLRFVVFCSV